MKQRTLSMALVMAFLALGVPTDPAVAGARHGGRLVVTVMFGAGLNTATPPSNPANHHVLPRTIRVGTGGVVNFVVAGFHQIFVYSPGTKAEDIVVPASGTFINDALNLYYQGILPAGGTLNIPPTANPSNAQNRVEPVSFSEPGTYLVICNVRTHFNNGMYAYVIVGDDDDDSHDPHHEHDQPDEH